MSSQTRSSGRVLSPPSVPALRTAAGCAAAGGPLGLCCRLRDAQAGPGLHEPQVLQALLQRRRRAVAVRHDLLSQPGAADPCSWFCCVVFFGSVLNMRSFCWPPWALPTPSPPDAPSSARARQPPHQTQMLTGPGPKGPATQGPQHLSWASPFAARARHSPRALGLEPQGLPWHPLLTPPQPFKIP